MNVEYVGGNQIDKYMNNPNVVMVDLRKEEAYSKSHIKGAINLPYRELERQVKSNDISLGKNKIYILYCERGSLSLAMAGKMSRLGYNVKTLLGGIRQYRGRYLETH